MHQKRRVRRVQHVRPSSAASKSATPKRRPSAAVKRSRATASRRGRLGVWGATRRQRPAAQSAWSMAMVDGQGLVTLSGTSIDTVGGGTMKRQSTRTYAASLHKVDQRYERRKRPACTARLRAFRYLDRLLTPPSRRVTARRRLREHSRASAKP